MRITPVTELNERIGRLQSEMEKAAIDAIAILQNADLFYFTGSIQQGVLYVPLTGEPLYMVRKEPGRARMESGLKEVIPFASLKEVPDILQRHSYAPPKRLGLELDVLPVATANRLLKVFPETVSVDASHLIRTVRSIKSDYEINIMKDAALQLDKVYQKALTIIRPGMTDLELAAALEYEARLLGHQGIVRMRGFNSELFFGHVFSGADSAAPAYLDAPLGGLGVNPSIGQGASFKVIEKNEPIIIDLVGAFDGYLVDMTRTVCIGGLPDDLMQAYADMRRVEDHLKTIARPGVTWGSLYDSCYQLACDMGHKEHFMGAHGSQVSFIGHGIGVEVDEYPFIARGFKEQVLEQNMCFAFEPKIVYQGRGAVGIENTFWVGADGLKHLTYSDPDLKIL